MSQLINGRHYLCRDTEDSIKKRLQLNVTLSNSYKFEDCYLLFFFCAASLLTLSTIAFDRLLAVSHHLRYQELVTSKCVTIVLISIWLTSFITALICIFLPKSNEMMAAVILLVRYVLTTGAFVRIYKVVKYYQNQIHSQNQLQNAQTREALRQRRSAYNALFVYLVFPVCYLPFVFDKPF